MTLAEIHGQRDRIEFLRDRESRFQALRTTQKAVFAEFEKAGGEAAAIKTRLLRTFDLFFAADPEGRQRVSDIRKGEGDPDLVQYALVMQTEARFRSAAAYWYEGTDKAKDYAAFVPPTKGSPADDSATDAAEPTVVTPPADA